MSGISINFKTYSFRVYKDAMIEEFNNFQVQIFEF